MADIVFTIPQEGIYERMMNVYVDGKLHQKGGWGVKTSTVLKSLVGLTIDSVEVMVDFSGESHPLLSDYVPGDLEPMDQSPYL